VNGYYTKKMGVWDAIVIANDKRHLQEEIDK
jgi:hypothetical protein